MRMGARTKASRNVSCHGGIMRRPSRGVVVLLFILFGILAFAFYDIEKGGSRGSRSSSSGDRRDGVVTEEEHPNTPRNERDIQKARREGTLRDGE